MSLFGSFGPGAALSGPGVLVGRQKVGSSHQNPKPRAGSFVSGSVSSLRPDAWTDTGPAPRPGSQPSYLLLAPAALRPGLPTSVSVSILSSSAFTVSAHIIHQGQTLSSSSTTVRGGEAFSDLTDLRLFSDQNPNRTARPGRPYILKVRGHGGVDRFFSNSTELLLHGAVSTFIQTDRAAYLPGQVVKIRAVSVLADGKPCVGPAHILIRDPRGNRVRQWLDEAGVLGVVSAEFPLSGRPPLGRWSVTASVSVSQTAGRLTRRFIHVSLLSGLTYNNSVNVTLAKKRFHIHFEDFPKVLRPSLSFSGRVNKPPPYVGPAQPVQLGPARSIKVFLSSVSPENSSPRISQSVFSYEATRTFSVCVQVKARGQLVSAGRSSGDLTLVPGTSWAPLASIVVYCVRPDGEVVSDVIHLPMARFLQNKVSLRWSSDRVKPAEKVALQVSVAEPGSLVGILVVDKATRWAGSHNDISMETVRTTARRLAETAFPLQMDAEPFEKQPELHERQNFPETWEVPLTVPDSITTWTASAFVVSEDLGLGITESAAELTVFQDFFLSLNLPAYIVRGEELVLEVVLFNFLQEDLEVTVIVADSSSFEFIFPDSEAFSMASVRHVYLEREGGATVLIPIRPLVLGEIPISVKAVSSAASDYVRTAVLVKAEGLQQTFSSSLLLDLHEKKSSVSRDVKFSFPAGVMEGSHSVSVTAVGDLLGPSITGLDSLIQMPSGCGEQNMVHFAPNIYVLQYLRAKGPALMAALCAGYEQELSYQRSDGSFSAFGEQDASGSTWLSAFVLRCFLQARPFISMDERVLGSAAAWLAGQQGGDGRMLEPGRVIHTELQGGLDGPVSLTSYVLMALTAGPARWSEPVPVSAARSYLETRLDQGVSSNYSLSLLTYALALAGSPASQTAVNHLIGRADVRDGVPTWSSPDGGLSSSWQPRSADIEMAAYVLLSLHKLDRVAEGLGLLKWLSQQRNHLGGYGSTQDTVVALQALSRFTALGGAQRSDINIRVTRDSDTVASFHIDQDNELLLQTQQLNVFYNIRTEELRRRRDTDEQEAFYLYVHLVDHGLNDTYLYICNSLSWDLGLNETGMVLMEVGLLSGFGLHPDLVKLDGAVKKVETQPGKVVLYLDSETCLYVPLLVEFKVGKVQEATVAVYDYYEPRRRTVRSYRSSWRGDASVCSFCGEDCSQCGANNDYSLNAAPRHGRCTPASGVLPALLLLFIICSV
uniref:CD109 molecule n=1 Tax=Fundulus heteroclitus TaxID=8078 RepID=A0A3Q2QMA5_FUNHE